MLANCYYNTKRYSDAISISQNILAKNDENLIAIQILGASFAAQEKFDLAIEVFKKAPLRKRILDEELMEVHYNLAVIYEQIGDVKNALKHYKKIYVHDTNYRNVSEIINELES